MYPASQDIDHERKYAKQVAGAKYASFDEYIQDHHLWNFAADQREELRKLYEAARPVSSKTDR